MSAASHVLFPDFTFRPHSLPPPFLTVKSTDYVLLRHWEPLEGIRALSKLVMGGEIYWPNKGRFPYLVNIFFIWLPPAKFWQRIIKTVWIPTIFTGGNVIPYLVNIFVPPLSDPLYGQYIIPPSLLWSIYHPLMTVIYFIPILVNILIDFIIFCNMIYWPQ